jgi:hypothetical protein
MVSKAIKTLLLLFLFTFQPLVAEVNYHIDYFVDTNQSVSIDEIKKFPQNTFSKLEPKGKNFGYSKSIHWLKYRLLNPTDTTESYIIQFMPTLDELIIYDEDRINHYGDLNPKSEPLEFGYILHHTSVEAHSDKVIWVRVNCPNSSLELKTDVVLETEYYPSRLFEFSIVVFYYAAVLILIVFNVIIFVVLKKRIFFYYVLFHTSLLIYFLDVNGIGKWLFWQYNGTLNTYILTVTTVLSLVTVILYFVHFIQIQNRKPFYYMIAYWLVLGSYSIFVENISWLFQVSALVSIMIMLIILTYFAWYKRSYNARYFIAAWLVFVVGIILMNLSAVGWIQTNANYKYIRQFGIVVEMVVITLYMLRLYAHQQKVLMDKSKKAQLGEMISIIAHQWKQPLSIINSITVAKRFKIELNHSDDENFVEHTEAYNEIEQQVSKLL